jgi:tripartite-type tricarboxylate transporter receptor subunit TctC
LAVTTAKRLETLPHLPTIGEFVPGYEASAWQGLGAPKNTPTDIIERLNVEVNAALADPRIKARLTDFGASVLVGSTADFAKLIAEETEKWGQLIRAANLKPE